MFNSSCLFCHTQLWSSSQRLFIQRTQSMTYQCRTVRFVTSFFYLLMHFEHLLQLVVTTTHNLLVYALPTAPLSTTVATGSPKKKKKKTKASTAGGLSEKVSPLSLQKSVPLPSSTGEGSTFRAARYILLLFRLRVSYSGLLDTIHRTNRFYLAS